MLRDSSKAVPDWERDETRQGKTRRGETRQDKKQEKTSQGETRGDEARQEWTRQRRKEIIVVRVFVVGRRSLERGAD